MQKTGLPFQGTVSWGMSSPPGQIPQHGLLYPSHWVGTPLPSLALAPATLNERTILRYGRTACNYQLIMSSKEVTFKSTGSKATLHSPNTAIGHITKLQLSHL